MGNGLTMAALVSVSALPARPMVNNKGMDRAAPVTYKAACSVPLARTLWEVGFRRPEAPHHGTQVPGGSGIRVRGQNMLSDIA